MQIYYFDEGISVQPTKAPRQRGHHQKRARGQSVLDSRLPHCPAFAFLQQSSIPFYVNSVLPSSSASKSPRHVTLLLRVCLMWHLPFLSLCVARICRAERPIDPFSVFARAAVFPFLTDEVVKLVPVVYSQGKVSPPCNQMHHASPPKYSVEQ